MYHTNIRQQSSSVRSESEHSTWTCRYSQLPGPIKTFHTWKQNCRVRTCCGRHSSSAPSLHDEPRVAQSWSLADGSIGSLDDRSWRSGTCVCSNSKRTAAVWSRPARRRVRRRWWPKCSRTVCMFATTNPWDCHHSPRGRDVDLGTGKLERKGKVTILITIWSELTWAFVRLPAVVALVVAHTLRTGCIVGRTRIRFGFQCCRRRSTTLCGCFTVNLDKEKGW